MVRLFFVPFGLIAVMNRSCRQCGSQLNGRIDKRFCDVDCKNQYHNGKRNPWIQREREVDLQLRTNRSILKHVIQEEETKYLGLTEFNRRGGDLSVITGIQKDHDDLKLQVYEFVVQVEEDRLKITYIEEKK